MYTQTVSLNNDFYHIVWNKHNECYDLHIVEKTYIYIYIYIYKTLCMQRLLDLNVYTSISCNIIFEEKLYKQHLTVFVLQFHFH